LSTDQIAIESFKEKTIFEIVGQFRAGFFWPAILLANLKRAGPNQACTAQGRAPSHNDVYKNGRKTGRRSIGC